MRHSITLLALLAFVPVSVLLAEDTSSDYVSDNAGRTTGAVWTEVGATKILPYNITIGLDAGFRTDEGLSEASRYDIGLGLSWKPSKHWKLGVGYTFLMKYYPMETERKREHSVEYKYRAVGETENTDFAEFMGAPTYTDADGTTYRYRGKNESVKDYVRVTEAFWRPKHRVSADVAYTTKCWKLLRVTLRERYQLTGVPSKTVNRTRTGTKTVTRYRDPLYDSNNNLTGHDETETTEEPADMDTTKVKSSKTLHTLRSRLTFEIDKKGWAFTPYAYCELFNDLSDAFHTDKVRASVGVEYAVTKQHKLSIGYVFNHENDDDGNENIHAVSVGYKFKF